MKSSSSKNLVVGAAIAVVSASWGSFFVTSTPPPGYTLVFNDDFNFLDTSVWTVRDNFTHGANEWQLYMGDEVSIQNSNMVIRTRYNPHTQGPPKSSDSKGIYNFTSGWVDTSGLSEYTYGHYEWVAKLPDPTYTSIWPALWLVQDKGMYPWPTGGEIDVIEAVGGYKNNSVFGTYHWGEASGKDDWETDRYQQQYPNGSVVDFSQNYHTFGVTWSPQSLVWSVDDVVYETRVPKDSNPPTLFIPSWNLYTIMNVAISYWGSVNASKAAPTWTGETNMYIDSFNIWQLPQTMEAI